MRFQTVLAPIDFSDGSEAEAEQASSIARHLDAQLLLQHVIRPYAGPASARTEAAEAFSPEFSSEIECRAREALKALAARVASGVKTRCVVSTGDPVAQIEELSEQAQANLVVMPTAGRGRLRRHLLGSVTTHVLHDLSAPVFTGVHLARFHAKSRLSFRRIACKLSLDKDDDHTLSWAQNFARLFKAELQLVTVLPFLDGWAAVPCLPQHLRDDALAKAGAQLGEMAAARGISTRSAAIGGAVDEVLPAHLESNGIDLVITSRRRQRDVPSLYELQRDLIDLICSSPRPTISV